MEERIRKIVDQMAARRMEAAYFNTLRAAAEAIMEAIPGAATVGIGNSQTLKMMDISRRLAERGNTVYDKTLAASRQEMEDLKKKALTADWYLTSANAIAASGELVNIDHSGNRVAAMIYGPDHVIVVAGINKVADSLDEAIRRARNTAAPRNAKRAGLHPPCVEAGRCVNCRSRDRVCNNLVVIEGQMVPGRMKVFLVGEEAGF